MPIPAGITSITVTGTYLAPDGTPLSGYVVFTPSINAADSTDNAIVPAVPYKVTLDADGELSVVLVATDDATWNDPGWTMLVQEVLNDSSGQTHKNTYNIEIPAASAGGTLDLADAEQVGTPAAPTHFLPRTGGTMTGDLTLASGVNIVVADGSLELNSDLVIQSSTSTQHRFSTTSYFETDSSGTAETMRLHFATPLGKTGNSAKNAIGFINDAIDDEVAQVWLQAHDYLHWYNAFTFAAAAVNTGTDRITATAHGLPSTPAWKGQFTTTGVLPTGISAVTDYYAKRIDANTIEVYTDAAASSLVNITAQGSGNHTFTPNNDYNNNRHRHVSFEVTNADLATKNTRFSIPYGYDTTEIGFFQSNVNVVSGKFRITGAAGTFRQFQLCNTLSDNLVPDGTEGRWSIQADSTAEAGSNVGSDFRLVRYTDLGVATDAPFFIKRSSGDVGINSTAPAAKFHVNGTAIAQTRLTVGAATLAGSNRLYVEDSTATTQTVLLKATADGTATAAVISTETVTTAKRAIDVRVTGDTVSRFRVNGDGSIAFGDGTAIDAVIARGSANQIRITPAGNASSSTSVGGALNVTNTVSTGAGLVVYSTQASPAGHLAVVRVNSATWNQAGLYVDYNGTNNGITIANTGTGASNSALSITSSNTANSALQITGTETGRGTIKVTHTGQADGSDSSSAAISIDLKVSGTAAQGIFLTATDGNTIGNAFTYRSTDNATDRFVVKASGGVGILRTAGSALRGVLDVGGEVFLANMTAPATPTGGGVIYVESGALKYKGSGGTVTTLGAA